jgi:hypothetical protein
MVLHAWKYVVTYKRFINGVLCRVRSRFYPSKIPVQSSLAGLDHITPDSPSFELLRSTAATSHFSLAFQQDTATRQILSSSYYRTSTSDTSPAQEDDKQIQRYHHDAICAFHRQDRQKI